MLYAEPTQLAELLTGLQSGGAGEEAALRVAGASSLAGRDFAVVVDPHTHSLLVRGDPETVRVIEDVLRELELVTPPEAGSKTLYASMLVNAEPTENQYILRPEGDYFCHFYDGSSGFLFRARLFARATGSGEDAKIQYGVKFSNYGETVYSGQLVEPGETACLVLKLTITRDSAG